MHVHIYVHTSYPVLTPESFRRTGDKSGRRLARDLLAKPNITWDKLFILYYRGRAIDVFYVTIIYVIPVAILKGKRQRLS